MAGTGRGDKVTTITNATARVRKVGIFRAIDLKSRDVGRGRSSSRKPPTIEKNVQEGRVRSIMLLSHAAHGRVQNAPDRNRIEARPDKAATSTDREILATSIPTARAGTPNSTSTWKISKNGKNTTPENHAVRGNQEVIVATTMPANTPDHGLMRAGIVAYFSANVRRMGKVSRLNMNSPNLYPSNPSGPTW